MGMGELAPDSALQLVRGDSRMMCLPIKKPQVIHLGLNLNTRLLTRLLIATTKDERLVAKNHRKCL